MDETKNRRGRPKKNSAVPVYKVAPLLAEIDEDKFAALPDWGRNLVGRFVETGDLDKAAKETGVSRYVKDTINTKLPRINTIKEALAAQGITAGEVVRYLKESLIASVTKIDKNGNPFETTDHKVRLQAIQIIREYIKDDTITVQSEKDIMDMFKIEEQDK